ncbi:RNA polymerase sigma factor [Ornithinicoccus halotolerans]|uniref:RNA polymerase sigma factor n=1 Tax=Ornithinicoccus halotolerans TaxID=1748220 RepID=UPI001E4A49C6|nr:sigma-70 family RNA polymerase sigma factor [Ornithinicoccus halotolerans]
MELSRADRAADVALVQGLAVDDEPATRAFVHRFQSAVYGTALSITRDPATAEDVAQEAFVKAWRAADGYDPRRASPLTWLLAITRNAAIDAVRARRTRPADPTEREELDRLLQDTLAPGPDDPQEVVVRRSEGEQAAARLRTLSPEQARAVVLAVVAGRTAAEVAAHEGIPLGTAKTRIRDGLRRLRRVAPPGTEPGEPGDPGETESSGPRSTGSARRGGTP